MHIQQKHCFEPRNLSHWKIKHDDLKIVEGIGPKIEELYHNAGIKTWKALSETPIEKSKEILIEAGERFFIHNPSTWAKQALLAYQGKWQDLKDWQDSLNAGKEQLFQKALNINIPRRRG